jgi:hypothetical protein
MTMTPQPTLEVPLKIAAGIAAGVFRRDGGVVRWADSGRIYTFSIGATRCNSEHPDPVASHALPSLAVTAAAPPAPWRPRLGLGRGLRL